VYFKSNLLRQPPNNNIPGKGLFITILSKIKKICASKKEGLEDKSVDSFLEVKSEVCLIFHIPTDVVLSLAKILERMPVTKRNPTASR